MQQHEWGAAVIRPVPWGSYGTLASTILVGESDAGASL